MYIIHYKVSRTDAMLKIPQLFKLAAHSTPTPYPMMGQAHTDDGDHPTIPEMSGEVFCIMWDAQFGS